MIGPSSTSSLAPWREVVGDGCVDLLLRQGTPLTDSLARLPEVLRHFGASRALVVVDLAAVSAAGLTSEIKRGLADLEGAVWFDRFTPNPTSDQAAKAARTASGEGADVVIAIGGGSCHDTAKIAALAAATPEAIDDLARGGDAGHAKPLPLIAVPTTAGTGSDATHFAAIYVEGRKISVAHPALRPAAAVLDVRLHEAMPAEIAATTGLDALAQALESTWAVGSTDASLAFAAAAGALIHRHLLPSVRDGTTLDRTAMMLAARLAGEAINISKTTAAHALSYELTQTFGVPHGLAAALTLGHVGRANARVGEDDCNDLRGPDYVRSRVHDACRLLDADPETLPQVVEALLGELNLPSTLAAIGVTGEDCHRLAQHVNTERLSNNPRHLDAPELAPLLARACVESPTTFSDATPLRR